MTNRINSILFAFASNSITLNNETNATLLLDDEKITMLMLMIADDEKNKMLPEAQSINQDGSQDGLMEAANIPLQSKEEDQMWKILNTDERCGGVCSGLKSSQLLIKFLVGKPNSPFYQILNSCDFLGKCAMDPIPLPSRVEIWEHGIEAELVLILILSIFSSIPYAED